MESSQPTASSLTDARSLRLAARGGCREAPALRLPKNVQNLCEKQHLAKRHLRKSKLPFLSRLICGLTPKVSMFEEQLYFLSRNSMLKESDIQQVQEWLSTNASQVEKWSKAGEKYQKQIVVSVKIAQDSQQVERVLRSR